MSASLNNDYEQYLSGSAMLASWLLATLMLVVEIMNIYYGLKAFYVSWHFS